MPKFPNSHIETSDIGIGCAYLTAGGLTGYETRLIDTAFEAGARHFDVAPQYGLGTAEKVLGRALKGKRECVTITTKAGIKRPHVPIYKLTARALLKPVRTKLRAKGDVLHSQIVRKITKIPRELDFSCESVETSLISSLRQLGTDYVDVFLLHMVEPENVTEDLVSTLVKLKASGKARSIGLATDRESSRKIIRDNPGVIDCVQYSWCVLDPRLTDEIGSPFRITHRALMRALMPLSKFLKETPSALDMLNTATNVDLGNRDVLARALVGASLVENDGGISLIASRSIKRTYNNVMMALDPETRRIGRAFLESIMHIPQLPPAAE